jgi:diguanylate cyclase (GGDEF)-like protein/PAS domain S-box-containing protein
MSASAPDRTTLDEVVNELATRETPALMAVVGPDGFRIAAPPSVGTIRHQPIPLPDGRATMTDLVIPADRLKVVETWEQCKRSGVGFGRVHMVTEPERRMRLTLVDAQEVHDCWLGFLVDDDSTATTARPQLHPEMLAIPTRPRVATIRKSWAAVITEVDASITSMLGWEPADMLGLRSSVFVHEDDRDRAVDNWMDMLANKVSRRIRYRHQCRDGRWLWIEVEHILFDAENPDDIEVEGRYTDISDEMAAHEEVRYREQLFSRLADSLPTGIAQIDRSGTVIFANRRLAVVLDVVSAEATVEDLLAPVKGDARPLLERALKRAFEQQDEYQVEVEVDTDGRPRHCSVSLVPVTNQDGTASVLVCVNDVTESALLRQELQAQATFDELTGCYNRRPVMAAVEHALDEDGSGTAVLFIDLDNFKPVNDRLGHAVGDELLTIVADRLREISRPGDIVGRLGGDEFLLVCRDVEDAEKAALAIARRVHQALHEPILLESGTVDLGASIGVACSTPGTTAEELVSRADRAMYRAKRQSDGPVLAPEPGVTERSGS